MEDMKLEQHGPATWQGYHNSLPVPSRLMSSYNGLSQSLLGPTQNGISDDNFHVGAARAETSPTARKTSVAGTIPPLEPQNHYPTLKRSWQTFEEGQYPQPVPGQNDGGPDKENRPKPTIHPDHRLLSFGQAQCRHTIFDQYGRPGSIDITAQIHGMFFLSEIATSSGEAIILQPELTCYRRNLFQVSGSVAGPVGPLSVLTDQGQTVPIVSQELSISATESVDGHTIRLIVIPWKTPPPNSPEVPPNQEQEPQPIPLFDHADSNQAVSAEVLVHPIAWRRLQFRVATANNGRRKELQQHFVLRLNLTATLADGTKLGIADAATAPIVVRGRSPRNFQARKEIPLIGSSASARGQNSQHSPVEKATGVAQLSEKYRGHELQSPDMLKRPYHLEGSFTPSPAIPRQDLTFTQWTTSQQPSTVSTPATTSTYVPQHIYTPEYAKQAHLSQMTEVRTLQQKILRHESRLTPYPYQSTSEYSHSVDSNPRPAKSPRHAVSSGIPAMPLYQSFEERVPSMAGLGHTSDPSQQSRVYFPDTLPAEVWTTAENVNGMYKYAASVPPHMSQLYTIPSQPQMKDESQHGPYDWSTA